jgi:hypothetical protein
MAPDFDTVYHAQRPRRLTALVCRALKARSDLNDPAARKAALRRAQIDQLERRFLAARPIAPRSTR